MENKIFTPDNALFWYKLDLSEELVLKATLSGGKGGQNVNKVSTKVELYWTCSSSLRISNQMKTTITDKLSSKFNQHGQLRLVCDQERSQLLNKEIVVDKFYKLLASCFKVNKPRKPTKPNKGAIEKRLTDKLARKTIKHNRGKLED